MSLDLRTMALSCGLFFTTACEPEIRSLGDEPPGDSGGSGGGSVLPKAGTFSGGASQGDPVVQGGATQVDPVVEGGATQVDCWSPVQRLPGAVDLPAPDCECQSEQGSCLNVFPIVDAARGGVFSCVDGRWEDVSPAVDCITGSSCQVRDIIYPSNWQRTPTPYSLCNTCECQDGKLVSCTGYKCADTPCPADTWAARRCVACGPAGGCQVFEIGCFPGAECEDGLCGAPCF